MLIDANELSLFIGKQCIVDKASIQIPSGRIVGLIGPNGAGKTSLLKMLAHVLPASSGDYHFAGQPIASYSEKTLARQIGYLAQDATAHWPLTVRRLVELGRLPYQGYRKALSDEDSRAVANACALCEVEHLLDRIATTLSGGEKTRVFLARLLAARPQVIFADEPIAALDPYHQLHVMEILQQHARNGGTVLVVMHDINMASRFCDELILLNHGKIVRSGSISELLADKLLADTYGITLKMFCDDDAYSLVPWQRVHSP
ncbi:MAG TPA: ABC transporter ATP-binding protein [Pseudomonadales bacterium]